MRTTASESKIACAIAFVLSTTCISSALAAEVEEAPPPSNQELRKLQTDVQNKGLPPMPMIRMGTPTQEETDLAISLLAKQIPPGTQERDNRILTSMQRSILLGDLSKTQESLNELMVSAEHLKKTIKVLQNSFDEVGTDLHVGLTTKGLIIYIGNARMGYQISPVGSPVMRKLEPAPHGYPVWLPDGEYLIDPDYVSSTAKFCGKHGIMQATADRSVYPNLNKRDAIGDKND